MDGIDGVRTLQADLVSERTYHQPRLKAAALEFILNDLSPEVKARLDGLRNLHRRGTEVPRASFGYQTRSNDGASTSHISQQM